MGNGTASMDLTMSRDARTMSIRGSSMNLISPSMGKLDDEPPPSVSSFSARRQQDRRVSSSYSTTSYRVSKLVVDANSNGDLVKSSENRLKSGKSVSVNNRPITAISNRSTSLTRPTSKLIIVVRSCILSLPLTSSLFLYKNNPNV